MTITNNDKNRTKCILITGVAGFIGSYLAHKFLKNGYRVVGIDILSDYYDILIKKKRVLELEQYCSFSYYFDDICDSKRFHMLCTKYKPDLVVHLAAQAGVIVSENLIPNYIKSNIYGTEVVVQECSHEHIPLLYASSSSVYGDCPNMPFRETDLELRPKSLYASSKLHNERIVEFYHKHLGLTAVGLRFFSIYGENMRPDMAISKFTSAIYHQKPITLYGDNNTARDFTYIHDLIHIMLLITQKLLNKVSLAPIYNIGNQSPVPITQVIEILSSLLNKTTKITRMPLRIGESQITYSDSSLLYQHFKYCPNTPIEEGLRNYTSWYLNNL